MHVVRRWRNSRRTKRLFLGEAPLRLLESSSCVFPVEDLLVVIIINIAQKLIPQIIHRSLYDLLLAIEIPVIGSPCNVCLTYDIRNRDFRESFLPKQRKKPLGYPLLHPFHILCGSLHQATGLSAVRGGTRGSWNTARLHRQRIFRKRNGGGDTLPAFEPCKRESGGCHGFSNILNNACPYRR